METTAGSEKGPRDPRGDELFEKLLVEFTIEYTGFWRKRRKIYTLPYITYYLYNRNG